VVKLSDSRLVDEAYRRRVEMTSLLAEIDDSVVGPLTTNVGIVVELGTWLAVVYPFVVGETPDICEEADVRRMATTMAGLHRSLQQLDPIDLPTVAALAAAEPPTNAAEFGQRQLLHGDFSPANLLFSDRQVRVFDFDDCGYGPIEFEVGNTLYMVLFDAAMSSEMERYERFRAWFVDEYRSASSQRCPTNSWTSRSGSECRHSVVGSTSQSLRQSGSARQHLPGATPSERSFSRKPAAGCLPGVRRMRADELHDRVVVANPEEDCSPAAFRLLIDELSIEPEPELESLDAAAVLETIRAESEHA
jgi:hypothetical protein